MTLKEAQEKKIARKNIKLSEVQQAKGEHRAMKLVDAGYDVAAKIWESRSYMK